MQCSQQYTRKRATALCQITSSTLHLVQYCYQLWLAALQGLLRLCMGRPLTFHPRAFQLSVLGIEHKTASMCSTIKLWASPTPMFCASTVCVLFDQRAGKQVCHSQSILRHACLDHSGSTKRKPKGSATAARHTVVRISFRNSF